MQLFDKDKYEVRPKQLSFGDLVITYYNDGQVVVMQYLDMEDDMLILQDMDSSETFLRLPDFATRIARAGEEPMPVPTLCRGVKCMQEGCSNLAAHKVGEENVWMDYGEEKPWHDLFNRTHELTAYLCEDHFEKLMSRDVFYGLEDSRHFLGEGIEEEQR